VDFPIDTSEVESRHILSSPEVEVLAVIATMPRSSVAWTTDPVLRSIKRSFARTKPMSENRLRLVLQMVQRAVSTKMTTFCFCERKWVLAKDTRNCWACKRCFPADSWHCETCEVCVINKQMPCHRCGGVSIEVGGRDQLPDWKQRLLREEEIMASYRSQGR
jgi:hypothetical protein